MLSYTDALKCIFAQARSMPVQEMHSGDAMGSVCAQAVHAKAELPPFANSAMDGYAVSWRQASQASPQQPLTLAVVGRTAAGEAPGKGVGDAWEIMTGAPLPSGYDTVVMLEQVEVMERDAEGQVSKIGLSQAPRAGQHVRRAGEDFSFEDLVLPVGQRVASEQIMAMAALGIESLQVYARPKVAVLSTGKELIEDAAVALAPGQIRNSNGPYLLKALAAQHCRVDYAGNIPDQASQFQAQLSQLAGQYDVIVSTGAVSAGKHDFVPDSLRALDATIHFHKVAIRPGKPLLFARLSNGAYYFGLPGNPISAAVGLRFFVTPLLRAMQGLATETYSAAVLDAPQRKKDHLCCFFKARTWIDHQGRSRVEALDGQESFKIKPLTQANAWLILPAGQGEFSPGQIVTVAPLLDL